MNTRTRYKTQEVLGDGDSDLHVSVIAIASKKISIVAAVASIFFIVLMPWSNDIVLNLGSHAAILTILISVISCLLGICALIVVFLNKKLSGYSYAIEGMTIAGIAFLIVSFLFPTWLEKKREDSSGNYLTIQQIHNLGELTIQYAHDHEGILPSAGKWRDLLLQDYTLVEKSFFNSLRESDGYNNFAFNKHLNCLSLHNIPGNTVLFFEAWGEGNLTGSLDLLKKEPKKNEYIYMFLVDGRVIKYRLLDGAVAEFESGLSNFSPFSSKEKPFIIQWRPQKVR